MNLNQINRELDNRLELIEDERKKKVIASILKNNRWYIELSFETVISILMDLNFNEQEAVEIYKYLITNLK